MISPRQNDPLERETALPIVDLWVDPDCPWAWETAAWLRDLRDRGLIRLHWHLFSLELNSSESGTDFWTASPRDGEAHVALMLARQEGGDDAFEALYEAIGRRLHEQREPRTPELVHKAAADAGFEGLAERAVADPHLPERVTAEYRAARDGDIFGVPTMTVNGSKPLYGPIIPLAPTGEDALSWWSHVRWLVERPDFFELKRWPRNQRPGKPSNEGA